MPKAQQIVCRGGPLDGLKKLVRIPDGTTTIHLPTFDDNDNELRRWATYTLNGDVWEHRPPLAPEGK